MVTLPKVPQSISSKNLPRFCQSIWVVIILPHTCHAPWDILVGIGRMGALISSKGRTTEPLSMMRKQTLCRMMLEMVVENEGWGSERTIHKIWRDNGIVLSYILRPVDQFPLESILLSILQIWSKYYILPSSFSSSIFCPPLAQYSWKICYLEGDLSKRHKRKF